MDIQTHAEHDADRPSRAVPAVGDIYAQAAQTAADYLQAFIEVPARSMDDWHEYHRTWVDWFGRTTDLTVRATRDLVGCRDLQHFVEMQRQYMQEGRRHFLAASTHLLDISTRVAETAGSRMDEELREPGNRAATAAKRRRAS